ncbi:hypothetical protein LDL08_34850 [Nonomuraea glycinis]|uniref:Tyr recombinase domain-containing protein n=1 Tax=Nonomuraea glycinis TaxID=2047744 RepID=A0A918ACG4_9ACTN|nr:hypothetical protein [Nonomuraea glycinis]MCA2181361.1 hypothetical protein [Nonomuraea glycinis]GGP14308.1 hypothetical protein GCM10012278_69580 [Nonomuraea glycinis]
MLRETAGRASEILALNVEDLDLDNWCAPVHSKGGAIEWVYLAAASLTAGQLRGNPQPRMNRAVFTAALTCISALASSSARVRIALRAYLRELCILASYCSRRGAQQILIFDFYFLENQKW